MEDPFVLFVSFVTFVAERLHGRKSVKLKPMRLRGHDMWRLDTHLCGAVLRVR